MIVHIDKNTLNSVVYDTKNVSYIAENFTYLLDNLAAYIDPSFSNKHEGEDHLKGGERIKERGKRSTGLGYNYDNSPSAAPAPPPTPVVPEGEEYKETIDTNPEYKEVTDNATITKGGTKSINAFGTDILVDEWTVTHGDVTDPKLKERYPAKDSDGPRSPYTCLITARVALEGKVDTRCYVQCNCKSFQTTFYEMLHGEGYTNEQSTIPAAGATGGKKRLLTPALCKHLYAIIDNHYMDVIVRIENNARNQSPVLTLLKAGKKVKLVKPVNPVAPPAPVVAKTRADAFKLIQARLQKEHARIKNTEQAYLDSRTRAHAGGSYHLYPFSVVLLNGSLKAIAYRNKNNVDPTLPPTKSSVKVLVIPNNPKIWALVNKKGDSAILWDMIRSLGEMPEDMQDAIWTRQGYGVHMEMTEIEVTDFDYLTETSNSILLSISELS